MSTLLHVDDEELILKAVKRDLAGPQRRIECFTSPLEAVEYLRLHKVDLIISDYRMPRMDGVVFLTCARQLCPEAMRIIVSGHADLEFLKDAINAAGIFRFIAKPWDSYELETSVRVALEFKQLQEENQRLADTVRNQKLHIDQQQREIARLEEMYPGITHVERDEDGAIVLDQLGP